ncbi:uncharacterized protein LOC131249630 [Magnolia sinica]|uniref:uncharacterized protein LOC131249630 n=1 Tax=Magnolia sinica TaxID=86752 RepID=UPI0026581C56|nr:uncharacterized protein LOC131249630 [Magnolia sinica]
MHYIVLFDSGASHSFVADDFYRSTSLPLESTREGLSVSTPLGKTAVIDRFCSSCPILIEDIFLLTNLFILPMSEFDVILGMDWIAEYHAILDCSAKIVTFCIPSMPEFQFVTEPRGEQLSCLLLCAVEESVNFSIDHMPIIYGFPDVFQEILLLLARRHTEFQIDLVPGIAPISKAPYHMARLELRKLQKQLMNYVI